MPQTPQNEQDDRYKEKLSPATYAKKQIGDILSSFGSLIVGGIVGNLIGKAFKIGDDFSTTEYGKTFKILPTLKLLPTAVGAIVGSMIGGIIKGYSRWEKHEKERLEISEINEDVANMKIRHRTDPELLKENNILRETLAAEIQKTEEIQKAHPQKSSATDSILQEGRKTHTAHAENTHSALAGGMNL